MQVAFLIPNDVVVRDPRTKEPLPKEGKMLSLLGSEGRYWRRRIKGGAVKVGKPPAIKAVGMQGKQNKRED